MHPHPIRSSWFRTLRRLGKEPVAFTGAIHEVRLKRNRDVGVRGLRRREGWEKVVVGYVTRGERRGVGGGESEITPFRDGSGFPGVEANPACFFVDFGNRGQAGGNISGCSIQSFSLAFGSIGQNVLSRILVGPILR